MRILFLNERIGFMGGVEQHIHDAARAMAARGHEVALAWGQACRDVETMAAPFAEHYPCLELTPSGVEPSTDTRLYGLVTSFRPDVLYLHKVPSLVPVEPYLGRIPTVRMIHDHDVCCPRRHKYFAFSKTLCERPVGWRCWADLAFVARDRSRRLGVRPVCLREHRRELRRHDALDRLLVGSRWMRDELTMNGLDAERIHIVPPTIAPVSPDAPKPTPPPDTNELLYVGQLIAGKGVDLLLRALARLAHPFSLQVAGVGNALDALRALSRDLGLDDRVTFLEWTPPERLAELYRRARVVVVPSRWPEPFGMVGVEAMRAARPVVAFAAGGIPDWLDDGVTGRLAPVGDVARLAEALDELLGDLDLCRRMGWAGLERADAEFSPDTTADALEEILMFEALVPKRSVA